MSVTLLIKNALSELSVSISYLLCMLQEILGFWLLLCYMEGLDKVLKDSLADIVSVFKQVSKKESCLHSGVHLCRMSI